MHTAATLQDQPHSEPSRPSRLSDLDAVLAALLVAVATAIVVTAYVTAKHSNSLTHFHLYWVGTLLGFGTFLYFGAYRLPSRWQRVFLFAGLDLFTYVPKFMLSPTGAVYFDEFGHWRHTQDLVAGAGVSAPITFQPIIKYYPGLELITAGVHTVTRLSVWHSGQIVILLAHAAMLVMIYTFARYVGLGQRIAFLATVLYAAGPNFEYFDSEFAYESLALPFAFAATLCMFRAKRTTSMRNRGLWCGLAFVAVVLTTVTHHLAALVAVVLLALTALLVPGTTGAAPSGGHARARRGSSASLYTLTVVLSAGFALAWFLATPTRAYLGPGFTRSINGVRTLLGLRHTVSATGQGTVRVSHTPFAGVSLPFYEKAFAYVGPAIAGVLFAIGAVLCLYTMWRSRRRAAIFLFVLLGAVYFISLPAVLAAGAGEAVHRTWSFTWLGACVTIAAAAQAGWNRFGRRTEAVSGGSRSARILGSVVVGALIAVITIGSVSTGASPYTRFPGPETFGTDTRFGNANLDRLMAWVNAHIPAGSNVVSDRYTNQELTGYTKVDVPSPAQSGVYGLYHAGGAPKPGLLAVLKAGNFSYWILDTRIDNELPFASFFQGYHQYTVSIDGARLRAIRDNAFIHLETRIGQYAVYRIHPDAG